MKFATKIGFSAAAVSLIVGPLLGVAVFLQVRSLLQERIINEQVQSATSVMREIDTAMYRAYLDVSMIAADELLREAVENPHKPAQARLKGELEERDRLTGPWRALMVFDQTGRAMFGPKPLGIAKNISAYPINKIAYEHALQGQVYYSEQIICPQTQQPFVIFAAPVFATKDTKKVVGVVIAQYTWTSIQQILDYADPVARVHLLDHEGEVIGRRTDDQHPPLRMPLFAQSAIKSRLPSFAITASSSHGEGAALTVELPQGGVGNYDGSGWILLIEQPLDIVFAPIAQMARNIALIVFFILLLQAALLTGLGRLFLRPLEYLLDGVKRVSSGDLHEKLTVHSKDEFGELADNFNVMTDKLQERTLQLQQAQDELVHKEKQAMLGQVAENVSNELRNPLGVMSNAVYYLQTALIDADDATREYLDIIKSEIGISERIISDLLDAVRTNPTHIATVNIPSLVNQVLRLCVIPATVSVKQNLPETLPPISVDPLQILQVLRNLIDNGVEAMPEGGILDIQALANAAENTVAISVRDSGTGIVPGHLAKIFQPMFTTKARGIGLGLAIVKNLLEANSGRVEVQSEPGNGTTFTITLPAVQQVVR